MKNARGQYTPMGRKQATRDVVDEFSAGSAVDEQIERFLFTAV